MGVVFGYPRPPKACPAQPPHSFFIFWGVKIAPCFFLSLESVSLSLCTTTAHGQQSKVGSKIQALPIFPFFIHWTPKAVQRRKNPQGVDYSSALIFDIKEREEKKKQI